MKVRMHSRVGSGWYRVEKLVSHTRAYFFLLNVQSCSANKRANFIFTHAPHSIERLFSLRMRESATLRLATLRRATTVVGKGSNVDDLHHFDAGAVDRADGTLSTVTGTFYVDGHFPQTCIISDLGAIFGSHLSSVRGVLFGRTEAHLTGTRLGDSLTLIVRQSDDDVIERRGNMSLADSIDLDVSLLRSSFFCHT